MIIGTRMLVLTTDTYLRVNSRLSVRLEWLSCISRKLRSLFHQITKSDVTIKRHRFGKICRFRSRSQVRRLIIQWRPQMRGLTICNYDYQMSLAVLDLNNGRLTVTASPFRHGLAKPLLNSVPLL